MKKIAIILAAIATVTLAACAGVQKHIIPTDFNSPAVVYHGQ
jgi:uncharacterized protein YceK